MISYTDLDYLPAMTTELWAKFFGVLPHKIKSSSVDKILVIRRFFDMVEEMKHE